MKKNIYLIEEWFNKIYNKIFSYSFFSNSLFQKILYFIGLTSVFLYYSRNYTLFHFFDRFYDAMYYIALISLFLKIILTKEKFFTYLRFLIYIILVIIVDANTKNSHILLLSILYIIGSRKVDVKLIFKYFFIVNSFIIMFNLFFFYIHDILHLSFVGNETTRFFYRGDLLRLAFYFPHPNTFSNIIFWTYIIYIYLHFHDKKKKWLLMLISFLLALFIYVYPNTRNVAILLVVSVPLLLIFQSKRIQNSKIFKLVNVSSFSLFCFGSFLLLFLFKQENIIGDIVQNINLLISNRIYLADIFLQGYGVSFLGNLVTSYRNVKLINAAYFYVDNLYYNIFIRYGLVIFFLIVLAFYRLSKYLCREKKYPEMYIILIFGIFNCIEATLFLPPLAFPIILLGLIL